MAIDPSDIARKSKKRFRTLVILSLTGVMILKFSFIFFFVGMLPALVAYIIDHDKHKYIFSTVTAFNLAGVFPYLVKIINEGNSYMAVKEELCNPVVLLIMYSAAGMGWAVVWVSPIMAATILRGVYQGRIALLESMQKKLEDEWGEDIKGRK